MFIWLFSVFVITFSPLKGFSQLNLKQNTSRNLGNQLHELITPVGSLMIFKNFFFAFVIITHLLYLLERGMYKNSDYYLLNIELATFEDVFGTQLKCCY